MINVGIVGLGEYLPEKVLTNQDLEKIVDTTDEWITKRTGIKERRIARDDEFTSDMAAKAATDALKDADMSPEDVELLIVATVTGDMQFPSTACLVQDKIGAFNAACFDISAACTGYIYAMATAVQFIKNDVYKNALIIGAEKLSAITDWTDRSTCV
jgi:3-oxoacyl-[acyl-carrier-protein] synthase-3